MTTHNTVTILVLGLALVGCRASDADIANGDDPIEALAVPHRSDRYTTTYWTQKSRSDVELWRQAVAFCEDKNDGDHPNCDAVRHVDMLEWMSRLPAESRRDFQLTVSDSARADTSRDR